MLAEVNASCSSDYTVAELRYFYADGAQEQRLELGETEQLKRNELTPTVRSVARKHR